MNERDTVDGTRVGNELRFINHASAPHANVQAEGRSMPRNSTAEGPELMGPVLTFIVVLVNGDPRIALTASKCVQSY